MDAAVAGLEAEIGRTTEALRAQQARGTGLSAELDGAREQVDERDHKLRLLAGELELQRAGAAAQLRGLAALGAELEEMRVASRGAATRIRLEALREAAEVSSGARRLEGASEGAVSGLFAALERAIDRLGSEWELPAGADSAEGAAEPMAAPDIDADARPDEDRRLANGEVLEGIAVTEEFDRVVPVASNPTAAELAALEEAAAGSLSVGAPVRVPVFGNGESSPEDTRQQAEAPAETAGDRGLVDRHVSVDVGPFSDFSQLVSFEDAANAIGATGSILIRRFSEGRASIDISLSEPIDLLAELERNCDLRFRVRSRSDDRIVLDLGD